MRATLKEKLGVDFRNYKILGACNPVFACDALKTENEIGSMLSCNVILQETEDNRIRISAVDPVASMTAVKNENLNDIADEVGDLRA